MNAHDWRWKIGEAIERLRTRYEHIGRKTGAPFLALVVPPEFEAVAIREWHTQAGTLRPEIEVAHVDLLDVTRQRLSELGVANVIEALRDPMPGSEPQNELGAVWIEDAVVAVRAAFVARGPARRVVSLERMSALHPATSPYHLFHALWESGTGVVEGPVVAIIPGTYDEPRVYSFLGQKREFMYRGDVL
jgi:hypothetical protein